MWPIGTSENQQWRITQRQRTAISKAGAPAAGLQRADRTEIIHAEGLREEQPREVALRPAHFGMSLSTAFEHDFNMQPGMNAPVMSQVHAVLGDVVDHCVFDAAIETNPG